MDLRFVLIFLLIIPCTYSYDIRINEVMANPSEVGEDHTEYIEIYNGGNFNININGWFIGDKSQNDTLEGEIIQAKGYAIIVDGDSRVYNYFNVSEDVSWLYVEDTSITSSGLNNNGEDLYLYNSSLDLIDSFSYDSTIDGKSWSLVDGTWKEQLPTPGYANNESWIYYEENKCDWQVEILSEDIFGSNEFEFRYKITKIEGSKTNITLIRSIEDIYGNIVKNYENYTQEITTQHTTPYLSPNLDEGRYLIKGEIFPVDCNDFNLKNNFDYKFITILPEGISQDYTKIKINELFPDPEGSDTASMPNGEFVELYNSGSNALDLENLSLKDNYGQDMDLFISDSNTYGTIINPNNYLVIYMNGRYGFLNNDGFEKISLYKDDYLLDEVSYSGSSEGLTWSKVNDKWILSLPTLGSENFNNESDITTSRLKVDKIYDLGNDDTARFGQIIRVGLLVYKGNTNKESIKVYVEDKDGEKISKESKVNVGDKFTNYTTTIPIQLISNCNQKFKDGTYYLIISGLDDTDKEEIEIAGIDSSLCKVVNEYKEVVKESYSSEGESVLNTSITGNVIYESENQGEYAVYGFCFSLIMLVILLLWKNE